MHTVIILARIFMCTILIYTATVCLFVLFRIEMINIEIASNIVHCLKIYRSSERQYTA